MELENCVFCQNVSVNSPLFFLGAPASLKSRGAYKREWSSFVFLAIALPKQEHGQSSRQAFLNCLCEILFYRPLCRKFVGN